MLRVVDLSSAPQDGPASPPGVIVAVGSADQIARSEFWLEAATFTLTEDACTDRRAVTVDSVSTSLDELDGTLPAVAARQRDLRRRVARGGSRGAGGARAAD